MLMASISDLTSTKGGVGVKYSVNPLDCRHEMGADAPVIYHVTQYRGDTPIAYWCVDSKKLRELAWPGDRLRFCPDAPNELGAWPVAWFQ
jgi:hypothetical protein